VGGREGSQGCGERVTRRPTLVKIVVNLFRQVPDIKTPPFLFKKN